MLWHFLIPSKLIKLLLLEDIQGSIAYAEALVKAKVLKSSEFKKLSLASIKYKKIDSNKFNWDKSS